MSLNESIVEEAALGWFGELGYAVRQGRHLAPGELEAVGDSFGEVAIVGRLREAIRRLNPAIVSCAIATLHCAPEPELLSADEAIYVIQTVD